MRVFLRVVSCSMLLLSGGLARAASSRDTSPPSDPTPTSRVVRYSPQDVIPLFAELRFTTLIVLPAEERILDFLCGDKDFWIVNGNQNLAYVKPAKSGARTNLNLVTASGNVYSFVLTEVSEPRGHDPDLKVYVELTEPSMVAAAGAPPRYVTSQQVEDSRQQVELAREDAKAAAQRATREVARFREQFPLSLHFTYHFVANTKPFRVRAIYDDGTFTFIQARSTEPPTLYEIKDGKPSLVQYQLHDGVYVVDKVLDQGYLAIGNKRLPFLRVE
jgi:type IV secretory pathway VirB9-like protein